MAVIYALYLREVGVMANCHASASSVICFKPPGLRRPHGAPEIPRLNCLKPRWSLCWSLSVPHSPDPSSAALQARECYI